jgi:chaperonin GroES
MVITHRHLEEGGTHAMVHAMKTHLRPLHDRILVERIEDGEGRHGRIVIPDTAKEKPQEGKVVAVGTGKVTEDGRNIPLGVKAGDRILFGKYSGSEVTLDDTEYLIMKEEDVLGIVA